MWEGLRAGPRRSVALPAQDGSRPSTCIPQSLLSPPLGSDSPFLGDSAFPLHATSLLGSPDTLVHDPPLAFSLPEPVPSCGSGPETEIWEDRYRHQIQGHPGPTHSQPMDWAQHTRLLMTTSARLLPRAARKPRTSRRQHPNCVQSEGSSPALRGPTVKLSILTGRGASTLKVFQQILYSLKRHGEGANGNGIRW